MKKQVAFFCALCVFAHSQAQDSVYSKQLDSILVTAHLKKVNLQVLPATQNAFIYKGKKSEVIDLTLSAANLADKTGRQVFAKVPGVFVYDMDGPGNQINIATRGLDPHRGWEYNIRKDGVITNSDLYGYPASHYSMPLESIDHIELVRGSGSLQYGSQFGGMLNFISKKGDTTRPFSFESINSVGSFGMLSTYNAISGKVGKFRYYAYIQRKSKNGYRDNEHTDAEAQNITLEYNAAHNLSITVEWSRSSYVYRIPGQLNDSMFHADPTQATRSRNYFNPDMHVPSIRMKWDITPRTEMHVISSAVLGRRNSVMFDRPTNIRDTINAATMQYNNRQVDVDRFNSYTTELKVLQRYYTGRKAHLLSGGVQYINNHTNRSQLGVGTNGSNFDLSLVTPGWGRDLHLRTQNVAVYAENAFELFPKFSLNTGFRMEMGKSRMDGTISYYPENEIPLSISHRFPLFGAGFSYKPIEETEIYGGWSQAYRAMAFKDLIPGSLYDKVDPNIKDANGYNAELGIRGQWNFLKWDVTGYLLQYNNRFGTLAEADGQGNFYTFRTNTGNSTTKGIEAFVQGDWRIGANAMISLFTSTALMDARYTKAVLKSGNENIDLKGNKVESTPDVISRNGVTYRYKRFSISGLLSYTAGSFADALNTRLPNATGAVGWVPSYTLLDFNASMYINKYLDIRVNANNITDKKYFTKRPLFYPGPGIWPSEGRGFNVVVAIKI